MQHLPAILWVLLSTALWTGIFAAAKLADGGIGALQITFLRYIGALATALLLAASRGGVRAHKSQRPFSHFLRAVCGAGGAVAITWSYAHMPIVDATAIGMLYGVLAVLLGFVVLKEHVTRIHWLAAAVSLAGAAVVMVGKGAFQGAAYGVPALAALVSAALLAIEGLLIRVLGQRDEALTIMLHVCFFGAVLMAGPAFLTWESVDGGTIAACIFLGPVAIGAQYCTIVGYRLAPLSIVAPVDYSWIVFATALGLLAFDERPTAVALAGCALIALGGVLLTRVDRG
ncbi:MAG: DMT family transporter [Alphaproteobacteria bacterium]|nr:DMT family transporter [Alphaproteobacteria bacterium]